MAYDISRLNNEHKNDLHEYNIDNENHIDSDLLNDIVDYYYFIKLSNYINENFNNIKNSQYFIFIMSIFFDYFNKLLDNYIHVKLYSTEKYNLVKDYLFSNNYVQELYTIDEKHCKKVNNIDLPFINKQNFIQLFNENNLILNNDSCILIKYFYKDNNYRLYIKYSNIENNEVKLPLEIENISKQNEEKYNKNKLNFFKNECSEIQSAQLNNIDIKEIIKECNGPFNDFGLLGNNKIYIRYLMNELNINNLDNLEIKYTNFHLDEDKMELVEHKIEINETDKYLTSDIIKKFINN